MKKLKVLALTAALFFALTGCDKNSYPPKLTEVPQITQSETLHVKKVENLSDDFIKGIDMSSLISLEQSGVKFYDFEGNEQDALKTIASCGVNYLRVRVWNDPYDSEGNGYGGGNNDIDKCIELGKRATSYGMKTLVNFHYSDFWADPGKQMTPKAWVGMNIDTKAEACYQYTKESLQKLKDAGVYVGMVQVGNETNGQICGEKNWMNIYKIMNAGSRATREIFPEAKVAVHFANPEKVTNYQDYAKKLNYYNLDYDIFASSYYPYWHGTLDNLTTLLDEISDKYNKDVLVMETSYAYTPKDTDFFGNTIGDGSAVTKAYPYTVQGQANHVRNVINAVSNMKRGIGVFYWEGAWITVGNNSWEENSAIWEKYGSGWASSYAFGYDPKDAGLYYGGSAVDNQAFFDNQGKPLESLKVWNLVDTGNNIKTVPDAIEDVNLIIDLAGEIKLPSTVNAVMTDDSKQPVNVTWDINDAKINEMKSNGVAKYTITGKTDDGKTATCYISMIEYNFLKNYSFEDGEEGWTATALKDMDELRLEDKLTDSLTGSWHYHYWAKNGVEFTLEQKVENLPTGKYKANVSIMGGDSGTYTAYLYIKVNGTIVAKDDLEITSYGSWDTASISSFEATSTDEVIFGVYVKCDGDGSGAWGKIDDALLNSIA